MENSQKLAVVIGGSGFVGRYVVRELVKQGWRVRVAVRNPNLAGFLLPMGAVGQIQLVQANIRYPQSVEAACVGADVVVNLVGILAQTGRQKFETVQFLGAETIAKVANKAGVKTLIHLSAIGADLNSNSHYARTKALGEQAVLNEFPNAVIFRPSIIFGMEDGFFNLFAKLATFLPFLPLIGGGKTKFQPVFVGDVAKAIMIACSGEAKFGTIYELGGAEVKNFKELLNLTLSEIQRKNLLVQLPFFLAKIQAWFMEKLPNPILTVDQVKLLEVDNVVSAISLKEKRTLQGLGISPTLLASILPSYLWRYRVNGQFAKDAAEPQE